MNARFVWAWWGFCAHKKAGGYPPLATASPLPDPEPALNAGFVRWLPARGTKRRRVAAQRARCRATYPGVCPVQQVASAHGDVDQRAVLSQLRFSAEDLPGQRRRCTRSRAPQPIPIPCHVQASGSRAPEQVGELVQHLAHPLGDIGALVDVEQGLSA